MGAQLAATVFVRDPDTRQYVELHPGTLPEPRLAVLVTNPAAWVGGKLPRLPKSQDKDGGGPTGDGQDDASGASASDAGNQPPSEDADTDKAAPAAKKPAARKTAASSRSRDRDAADQGDSGA
jgi:hypothetical protein